MRVDIVDIVDGGVAKAHLVVVFFTIRIRIVVLDVIRALERGGRQHVPDVLRRERAHATVESVIDATPTTTRTRTEDVQKLSIAAFVDARTA